MYKCFGIIYITTNLINGKQYIGQSTKINCNSYLGSGKALKLAIKKYGKNNFSKQILISALNNRSNLNYLEELIITENDASNNPNFYNISLSAYITKGFKGKHHSISSNIKRSKSLSGRKLTEEHIQKLRGRKVSEASRLKMSIAGKQKRLTEEHKAKISISCRGIKRSNDFGVGSKNPNAKKWIIENENGEKIEIIGSIKKWCNENKLYYQFLRKTLNTNEFYKNFKVVKVLPLKEHLKKD